MEIRHLYDDFAFTNSFDITKEQHDYELVAQFRYIHDNIDHGAELTESERELAESLQAIHHMSDAVNQRTAITFEFLFKHTCLYIKDAVEHIKHNNPQGSNESLSERAFIALIAKQLSNINTIDATFFYNSNNIDTWEDKCSLLLSLLQDYANRIHQPAITNIHILINELTNILRSRAVQPSNYLNTFYTLNPGALPSTEAEIDLLEAAQLTQARQNFSAILDHIQQLATTFQNFNYNRRRALLDFRTHGERILQEIDMRENNANSNRYYTQVLHASMRLLDTAPPQLSANNKAYKALHENYLLLADHDREGCPNRRIQFKGCLKLLLAAAVAVASILFTKMSYGLSLLGLLSARHLWNTGSDNINTGSRKYIAKSMETYSHNMTKEAGKIAHETLMIPEPFDPASITFSSGPYSFWNPNRILSQLAGQSNRVVDADRANIVGNAIVGAQLLLP